MARRQPRHRPKPKASGADAGWISIAPASPRKAAASRANALRSTGPRTTQGKQRVRLNALKHGLYAADLLIPTLDGPDCDAQFRSLFDSLVLDLMPRDTFERHLVETIAASHFRMRRVLRFEKCCEPDDNRLPQRLDLDRLLRAENAAQRSFYRSLAALTRARSTLLASPLRRSDPDARP
jgi:hypothetical protein